MKKYFLFNKSQRNGILFLVLLIIILQIFIFFKKKIFHLETKEIVHREEVRKIQKRIDSLKDVQINKNKPVLYPFNPNFITDYKGYTLGMSVEEIDRLLSYREKDLWVNSAEEFQKVTGVSDSLLNEISPYFKFPEFVNNQKSFRSIHYSDNKTEKKGNRDLNLANEEDLTTINGIGEVLAKRIISYRTKLGGFRDDIQLKDIYGLSFETREKIGNEFRVLNKTEYNRISLQYATAVQLAEIPYFDYELAREIVSYRQLHEGISSFEELAKIKAFPSEKIDRIALYLSLE